MGIANNLERIANYLGRIAVCLEKMANIDPEVVIKAYDLSKIELEDNNLERLAAQSDENKEMDEAVDEFLGSPLL